MLSQAMFESLHYMAWGDSPTRIRKFSKTIWLVNRRGGENAVLNQEPGIATSSTKDMMISACLSIVRQCSSRSSTVSPIRKPVAGRLGLRM